MHALSEVSALVISAGCYFFLFFLNTQYSYAVVLLGGPPQANRKPDWIQALNNPPALCAYIQNRPNMRKEIRNPPPIIRLLVLSLPQAL